jgi:hypothetical protein
LQTEARGVDSFLERSWCDASPLARPRAARLAQRMAKKTPQLGKLPDTVHTVYFPEALMPPNCDPYIANSQTIPAGLS